MTAVPAASGPASGPSTSPPRRLRRARLGVALLFLTNAIAYANLVPRLPQVRVDLGLSYTQFGLAIAMMPVGALVLGLSAGALLRRFQSARVGTAGMIAIAAAVVVAGLAPNGWVFAGALFFAGAFDAVADVAQNAHGLRVQRGYGRSILNGMHGIWSIGAVAGGLMGGAAAGLGIPLSWHLLGVAVLVAVVVLVGHPMLLTGPDPRTDAAAPDERTPDAPATGAPTAEAPAPDAPHHSVPNPDELTHDSSGSLADAPAVAAPHVSTQHTADPTTAHGATARPGVAGRTWLTLVALGVIAMSGTWVEDAGATWGASYLGDELGAGATLAALGFVALQLFQFVGRITGDRMVDRWGQRAVARTGAAIGLLGMGTALALPTVPGTILGFGAAGFGVATLIPSAMAVADELPGFKHGAALTYLGWLLRASFLVSPPLVGLLADSFSIRVGLALMPVSAVMVLLLARVLTPKALTLAAHGGAQ
ncbi:MFS transporter [Demequina pelophila]|uniref:MFS transporter n=1 Tax=Demequina pelophila TaxID=1638984 RepID=UPI00078173B7|nr:MFS transporter [Demequina pelophila]